MQLLEITDGTTTIDFLNMAGNYSLENEGWRPTVPNKRMSQLGGNGSYESVGETMDLLVRPVTGGLSANEALVQLRLLMEQAERWGMGDTTVDPVRLRFQLEADAFPQENVIVGASGNAPIMTLPPQHVDLPLGTISHPVTLDFERRGDWLFYPEKTNYIKNGSFEAYSGGAFADWFALGPPTSVTQTTDNVVNGTYSARIVFSSILSDGILQDITGLTAASSYRISVWVKPEIGSIQLFCFDGGAYTNAVSISSTGTTLQRLSVTKAAAAGGIRIVLFGSSIGATAYVDSVQLELGTTTTDWVPSISSFVAESTAATIPSVHTLAWDTDATGEGFDNPTDISIDLDYTKLNGIPSGMDGVVVFARESGAISIINAGGITTSGVWTSKADAGNYAFGGTVLAGTAAGQSGTITIFSGRDVQTAQVFLTVKPTDGRVWGLRVVGNTPLTSEKNYSPIVYIEGQDEARVVNMGSIRTIANRLDSMSLEITSVSGSGAGELRVDAVILYDAPYGAAATINQSNPLDGNLYDVGVQLITGLLPNDYRANAVSFLEKTSGTITSLRAAGSIGFMCRNDTMYAVPLFTPFPYGPEYRLYVLSSSLPVDMSMSATRAIANLLPN